MANSQIEITPQIKDFIKNIKSPITPQTLIQIRDLMFDVIKVLPYDDSVKEYEQAIRWRRTATEILNDGYVYRGKACTDLTVLFIALCEALGLETKFVKLKKEKAVHSVAEIKLSDGWYIFDVSNNKNMPMRGIITKNKPYKDWRLWRKGRDAWDLGLHKFSTIKKIK